MKIRIQWHTANLCNGITVKTHQETVKMNYSGLLYYVQVFAIQGTCRSVDGTIIHCISSLQLFHCTWSNNCMQKIQWKTVNLITVHCSGLLYFVQLFPFVPYLQCSGNICRVSKGEKLECPKYVFYSILHRNFLIWCKYLHAYYVGCYILLKDDLLVCHFQHF